MSIICILIFAHFSVNLVCIYYDYCFLLFKKKKLHLRLCFCLFSSVFPNCVMINCNKAISMCGSIKFFWVLFSRSKTNTPLTTVELQYSLYNGLYFEQFDRKPDGLHFGGVDAGVKAKHKTRNFFQLMPKEKYGWSIC